MATLAQPQDQPVIAQFSLKGKVAAVTGGARGIGLAAARGLAEAGASVALIYSTSGARAPGVAAEMARETGSRVEAFHGDVSDAASIAQTLETIFAEFGKGRLDIVVANAGLALHRSALDTTPQDWRKLMDVNSDGAFYTAQAAGRIFERQRKEEAGRSGSLIFTASVSATLVNIPQRQAAYNTSKAAVVHLAKSLAVEWTAFARVNCISPGFIATEMIGDVSEDWKKKWHELIPGERFAQPYELKGAYVFLASDASSYMTGADIIIDGGYTLP